VQQGQFGEARGVGEIGARCSSCAERLLVQAERWIAQLGISMLVIS